MSASVKLEVTVESVIPDNTAYTACVSLRDLGCDWLERVERAEGIELVLGAGADPAAVVERVALAEVIYNPNKHRLFYIYEGADRSGPAAGPTTGLELLVQDREDDTTGLVRLLRDTFGMRELTAATRFVAWRLGATATRAQLEEAAAKLLVNPNSQDARVAPRPFRIAWSARPQPEPVG